MRAARARTRAGYVAATANPVSYLLELVRSLIITGWDGQPGHRHGHIVATNARLADEIRTAIQEDA